MRELARPLSRVMLRKTQPHNPALRQACYAIAKHSHTTTKHSDTTFYRSKTMIRGTLFVLAAGLWVGGTVSAQTREEKVRGDKAKVEADGFWIYNDLAKGYAEAKQTGKPILVVM